jgi:hypothetical protein
MRNKGDGNLPSQEIEKELLRCKNWVFAAASRVRQGSRSPLVSSELSQDRRKGCRGICGMTGVEEGRRA